MAYSLTRTASWLVASTLALAGCDLGGIDGSDLQEGCRPNPQPEARSGGHLGEGDFVWSCSQERDAYCGEWHWPSAVALGAHFEADFRSDDAVGSRVMAIGGVTDLGLAFEAHAEGEASLIVRKADAVVDFIALRVRPVSRIVLSRPKGRATDVDGCDVTDWSPGGAHAEVVAGERIDVQASPYDGPTLLAGALDYTWQSLTPELLVVTPSSGRLARIDGLAEGTGRVAVRVGDFEEIIDIPVHAAADETTGADDTTTGGTGGSESGDEGSAGESSGGSR